MRPRLLKVCCLRVALLAIPLLQIVAALPLRAEPVNDCSWAGPDLTWVLERPLPAIDVVGSLGSDEILGLLHDAGAPISFIAGVTEDPEVHFQRSVPFTVRYLLDEIMAQTPGYRLDVISGKVVIYPSEARYDQIVEMDPKRVKKRFSAFFTVLEGLGLKSSLFHENRLPSRRGELGYQGDEVSVGGSRSVVEHLLSLVAGTPSGNIVIKPREDGLMTLAFWWADLIESFLIEVPERIDVGKAFQILPRLTLVDGTTVELTGGGCGIRYQTTELGTSVEGPALEAPEETEHRVERFHRSQPRDVNAESVTYRGVVARVEVAEPPSPVAPSSLSIERTGQAIATKPGRFRISARYLGLESQQEIEVVDAQQADGSPKR